MESLIPILTKVELVSEAVGDDSFKFPRIVVVGSQGSGKSSVLENIVGRSFLPKGTGIVTRAPLVLNCVHSPREPGPHRREQDGTLDAEEYGVFDHTETIFTDFDDICSEIQRETKAIAGHNKEITNEEITLNLYTPKLPNLTLVDMPGLDQPDDVETCIRYCILEYIQRTDAIIMAVVPANTDMATNASLKLAKDCDPEGLRTLVVLTKVDLMDAGTDATDILTGKVIPVKLGIVAVVNRSQKDITDKKPIARVIMDEAEFLRLKYPSLADCNGTSFLVATLKKLLLKYIKDYLVEVSSRVEMRILQAEALLDFYSDDDEEKDRGLMKIIREFSSAYSEDVRASAEDFKSCNIYSYLHRRFMDQLSNIDLPCTREAILSHVKTALFPEKIFELFMSSPTERLEEASINCAQLVFEQMKYILRMCADKSNLLVQKFPALRNKILVVLELLLLSKLSIAEKLIREESFHDFSRRIVRECEKLNMMEYCKQIDDKKCDMLMKYLPSLFEIARETVRKDVTVTIMLLVNDVFNNVEDVLVGKFSSPRTGRIFHGDQNFSEERKKEKKTLEALCKVRDIIGELNEKC